MQITLFKKIQKTKIMQLFQIINKSKPFQVVQKTASTFMDTNITKMSASLSYYSIFSMGPFVLLLLFILGFFLSKSEYETLFFEEISKIAGVSSAELLQTIVSKVKITADYNISTFYGSIILLVAATTLFAEIQDTMNLIWGVKPKSGKGVKLLIRARLISLSIILGLGFLFLVSFSLNTLLTLVGSYLSKYNWFAVDIIQAITLLMDFMFSALVFALIFIFLPDAQIDWRQVKIAVAVSTILFVVGKLVMGEYIGILNLGDMYGAAGSLIVLLVWIYYSSIILYLGACISKSYTLVYDKKITPELYAQNTNEGVNMQ